MEENDKVAIYRLHADFCKTLADASRLLMLHELAKGEISVGELARQLGLNQSGVSKHLSVMKEHGLALSRRDGAMVYYRLSDARILQAIRLLCDVQADQIDKQQILARAT